MKNNEYTQKELVKIYEDIVDPEKRLANERCFFMRQLKEANRLEADIRNLWVMDSAAGAGIEAVSLHDNYFQVVANEVDPSFHPLLVQRIGNRRIPIQTDDWRELPTPTEELKGIVGFGGILCVGNSITYMMNQEDLDLTISNFTKLLLPGGVLIIDHRNYDYILDEREHILADPRNNFRFKKKYYYIGEKYDSYYVEIEDNKAVQEIADNQGKIIGHFTVHPRRVQEMTDVLQQHGLEDRVYSDFVEGIDMIADFFQHVAVKV